MHSMTLTLTGARLPCFTLNHLPWRAVFGTLKNAAVIRHIAFVQSIT